jgi:hypothetical protein
MAPTDLPLLFETSLKIAILADVASHCNMPRKHLRRNRYHAHANRSLNLDLGPPSTTNLWDPHVRVIFNLKHLQGRCLRIRPG